MGLLSVSSTISCSSRAMEGGGDGRAFGRVAADHAVPLSTGANTPRPRCNTPSFGYPDNLQSNGCCTFN